MCTPTIIHSGIRETASTTAVIQTTPVSSQTHLFMADILPWIVFVGDNRASNSLSWSSSPACSWNRFIVVGGRIIMTVLPGPTTLVLDGMDSSVLGSTSSDNPLPQRATIAQKVTCPIPTIAHPVNPATPESVQTPFSTFPKEAQYASKVTQTASKLSSFTRKSPLGAQCQPRHSCNLLIPRDIECVGR
jgi:hypothetical protein